jgi:ribosomal protein L24
MRWKHRKPTQKNPKGERVQQEVGIHASNVMHVDEKTGKPTRKAPVRTTSRGESIRGSSEDTPTWHASKKST